MPGADYQHSADPVHSKASRDGEPRPPRTHKEHRQKDDPRDRNRREELQGPGDRSSLPPGSEYHPPEQRRMQDRHSRTRDQERARDGKEVNRDWSQQQRHVEDRRSDREEGSRQQRNMDDKIPDREDGSRDRYREDRSRDRYREDRSRDRVEKSRYQEEGTQDRHWEDRSQDKHWEKSRSRERDRYREERGQPLPRDPKEMNFHQESTYYNKDAPSLGYGPPPRSPTFDEREYYESQPEDGILECNKCRYLCTGRACCQLVEVLLNMLILVCASVSYNSTGGFTGITNMGGIYYYAFGGAYSGFQGADGENAQKLDVQFYQLKLPAVTAAMAFGGALMSFSCLMILIGVFRLPWYFPVWLLVECILDILIACGYLPALYFYFRKLLDAYETQVCKDREALYKSKGYEGFSCALHGADIAAGLFGCMAIGVFALSAVLAVRGYRRVRLQKKQPVQLLEL